MNIRRKQQFKPEVSTSSLNDIMFFLLLFFLIVSTLANPNVIKVLLPKSRSAQEIDKQQINLTVTEDRKYYIDQKEVLLSELEQKLQEHVRGIENPTVVLRFAKTLNIQDLVDVLEVGVRLNVKMVMATDKSNASL
ncbi:MAG TPA: biopolymer transporter ExbD [Bacteroidales bacterium]|jgi:biopolymer transport protein ExbD|nr:biopolymer transporter ExbD [Bacteroidales bacterium]MDI9554134.1 biopolymer transporter ExbD [Bacteroidota bacterium]MBP7037426.1 biopolymer transporter ExbD [Bacteroidales bacterium]MZP65755.1 biopolymer transporter ExbD [Bacteroidales bacterium]NLK54775.1 biopolymer transporter ExbD [Bacteroidales bacterium]